MRSFRFSHSIRIFIAWITFIGIVVIIYSFSMESGSMSFNKSWFFVKLFQFMQRWIPLSTLHVILRKIAHFTEYCLLGLSSYNLLSIYFSVTLQKIVASIIIGFMISSSDEMIQKYISIQRSGQIADVAIDMLGVSIGICILLLISHHIKR